MKFRVSKVKFLFRTEEMTFDGTPEECSKLLSYLSIREEVKGIIEATLSK